MKIILLFLCAVFPITLYSQNLKELELLTLSKDRIDSVEVKLKSWQYSLIKVENSTVDSINYDTYFFQRPSSDNYISSTVMLSKNKTDKTRTSYWDVCLVTFSEKKFEELRQESIKSATVKLSNQAIRQSSFIRNYKDNVFDYSFIMDNTKETSPIFYFVKIRFNK